MEHRDCHCPADRRTESKRRRWLSVHWCGWLAVPLFGVAGFMASSSFALVQGLTPMHAALHAGVNLGAGLAIALVASSVVARLLDGRRPVKSIKSAATFAFVTALAFVSTLVTVTALDAVARSGPVLAARSHRVRTGYPFAGADTSYAIPAAPDRD
jgi:hypothetical protein